MSSLAERVRVSVFVQAYNTARYVGECLESILRQEATCVRDVFVVDDASTDGTSDEVARFESAGVRLVRHARNLGATATANEGYAAATGDFVIRLDSDDRLRPGFLAAIVPVLLEDPTAGLAYGDIAIIDDRGHVNAERVLRRDPRSSVRDEFFALLVENDIPAPTTVVRRTALAPLLPIPSTLSFVDWYITTGIAERWTCAYVDAVLADYRVCPGSLHHTMVRDRSGEASSLQVLDRLYANGHRTEEKRRWRRRVYGSHYLTYADKYFGSRMNRDARRCYWHAVRYEPWRLLNVGVARRMAATVIGRRAYDALKAPWAAPGEAPDSR
jgi:glycosyltransferase involved in cell wall biosynthesis